MRRLQVDGTLSCVSGFPCFELERWNGGLFMSFVTKRTTYPLNVRNIWMTLSSLRNCRWDGIWTVNDHVELSLPCSVIRFQQVPLDRQFSNLGANFWIRTKCWFESFSYCTSERAGSLQTVIPVSLYHHVCSLYSWASPKNTDPSLFPSEGDSCQSHALCDL